VDVATDYIIAVADHHDHDNNHLCGGQQKTNREHILDKSKFNYCINGLMLELSKNSPGSF
jgi:hypothetical protein